MRPIRKSLSVLIRFFSASNNSSRRCSRFTTPMTTRLLPICSVPHSNAFQTRRRFGDARWFHQRRRRGGQTGTRQFIFAIRQRRGALVHRFGDGFIHEVDDEFVRGADVQGGVLGRAVVAVAGRKGDNRRLRAQHIEEAERRGVHPAVRAEGGDQRNRPRRDKADEQLISAVGKLFFQVEFHNDSRKFYGRPFQSAQQTRRPRRPANGSNSRSDSSLKSLCPRKNSFTTSEFSSGSRLHVL